MKNTGEIELVGVGSPIVDYLAHVPESFLELARGEKGGMVLVDSATLDNLISKLPQSPAISAGGSAGNTTFALAELGLSVAFLGKLGSDLAANIFRDQLRAAGGQIDRLKVGAGANARCLSLVTPDSERTMRTDLGAAMTLDANEITADDFKDCRRAHIEGYLLFNRNLMMAVLSAAHEAGCSISLDLASFEVVEAASDILPDILSRFVDVVFANEEEGEAFAGSEDPDIIMQALRKHVDTAVLKLGSKGSIIDTPEGRHQAAPYPVDTVVDTTGAGDYFGAGFLYGLAKGWSIEKTAELASRLGAEAVTRLGADLSSEQWSYIRRDFGMSA